MFTQVSRCVYLSLALLFGQLFPAAGSNFVPPAGARSWGLGNASATLSDVWSMYNNQAGLGFLKKAEVGTYMENRFRMKELNLACFALAIPGKSGNFGLSISYFGYAAYNEQKLGFTYARAFGQNFSFGFQLSYQSVNIKNYGSTGSPSVEAGITYKMNKKLTGAFHIYNPTRQQFPESSGQKLPTIAKLGLAYQPSDKLLLLTEVQKDFNLDTELKAGMEYTLNDKFALRAGLSSLPLQNTFGIGFRDKRLRIDLASSIHPRLGVSPHLSLQYQLSRP